jgi:hypothetical protein
MNPLAVTKLLSDEHTVKILTATYRIPRSANYLSVKFNIPIADQSTLKSAYLTFENGKLKALLELTGGTIGEEEETWNAISTP